MKNPFTTPFATFLMLAAVSSTPAVAGELPQTTEDGLQLVKQENLVAVYVKPGASLEAYDKVILVDAYVEFAKDWQQDYNRSQRSVSEKVTDDDMERIKGEVAEEFVKVFTRELEEGGYEITTETGPDVMVLRPAIVNLRITAPDLPTAWRSATIVNEAGSLALYAELYDSVTNEKFAEVLDQEIAELSRMGELANRVNNRAALDKVLAYWADLLRARLDAAHGK